MGSRGEALGRPNSEPAHTWDHVLNQTTEKGNFLFLQDYYCWDLRVLNDNSLCPCVFTVHWWAGRGIWQGDQSISHFWSKYLLFLINLCGRQGLSVSTWACWHIPPTTQETYSPKAAHLPARAEFAPSNSPLGRENVPKTPCLQAGRFQGEERGRNWDKHAQFILTNSSS